MLVFQLSTVNTQQTNRFAEQHFDSCTSRTSQVCLVHLVVSCNPTIQTARTDQM